VLDNADGARSALTGDVWSRCELDPLLPVGGSQSFDSGFEHMAPTHPFVGLVVFYAVGPNPWHRHAVLASLDREFTYESPGRISPRFKLTMTRRGAQS
jgi:hypothetical protein